MRLAKIKLFALLTFMLCMGVFHTTAYACDNDEGTLTVNAVWVDGELLRINVTDKCGNTSALAMRLEDYVIDAENQEFISVQAADLLGNVSGIIRIRNPFFDPDAAQTQEVEPPPPNLAAIPNEPDEEPPSGGMRPFTPDGSGAVVDNAHGSDGIEFFTIGTEDGNVFYLIIDRQRSTDNVYLLNAVTEEDLISLAGAGGREVIPHGAGGNLDAIPNPVPPATDIPAEPPDEASEPSEPENEPQETSSSGNDNSMLIIIGIAALVVGGVGYYFKIVRPKQNAMYDDDEEDTYGYEDEDEDGFGGDEDGDER